MSGCETGPPIVKLQKFEEVRPGMILEMFANPKRPYLASVHVVDRYFPGEGRVTLKGFHAHSIGGFCNVLEVLDPRVRVYGDVTDPDEPEMWGICCEIIDWPHNYGNVIGSKVVLLYQCWPYMIVKAWWASFVH